MNQTFPKTREALIKWEAEEAGRYEELKACKTNEDVRAFEAKAKAADQVVQDAFYEDTKVYNSQKNCRLVHPLKIRDMINPPPRRNPYV